MTLVAEADVTGVRIDATKTRGRDYPLVARRLGEIRGIVCRRDNKTVRDAREAMPVWYQCSRDRHGGDARNKKSWCVFHELALDGASEIVR